MGSKVLRLMLECRQNTVIYANLLLYCITITIPHMTITDNSTDNLFYNPKSVRAQGNPDTKWYVQDSLKGLRSSLWENDFGMENIIAGLQALRTNSDWNEVLKGNTTMILKKRGEDGEFISDTWKSIMSAFLNWMSVSQEKDIQSKMRRNGISRDALQARVDRLDIPDPLDILDNHGATHFPEIYGYQLKPDHIQRNSQLRQLSLRRRALDELIDERKYHTPELALAYLYRWETRNAREKGEIWAKSYPSYTEAEAHRPDLSKYPSEITDSSDGIGSIGKDNILKYSSESLHIIELEILWHKRYIWQQLWQVWSKKSDKWVSFGFANYSTRYLT